MVRLATLTLCCTALLACGDRPEQPSVDGLSEHALVLITPADTLLSEVVELVPLGDGRPLVVSAYPPFLQIFAHSGQLDTAVALHSGEGPGEFRKPWRAAAQAGRLWILDASRLVEWSLDDLREVAAHPTRVGAVALTAACGSVTAIYAISERTPSGRGRLGPFGISRLIDSVWVSYSREMATPFAPVGYGIRAVPQDTSIVVLNPYLQALQTFSCGGRLLRTSPIELEAGEGLSPEARGAALIGDRPVFFLGERASLGSTIVVVLQDTAAVIAGTIRGSFRLLAATDSLVWVLDESISPRLIGIEVDRFRQLLRIE